MSNSLSPVQRSTTLGGDVINLATSMPVNGCAIGPPRGSARSRKRGGLHLRAQVRRQEEALSKIERLAISRDGRTCLRTRRGRKAASLPRH